MALTDVLLRAADALEAHRFRYMVIGGLALAAWVEPRLTRDVDLIVDARKRDATRLRTALVAAGTRTTGLEMRLLFEKRFVRLTTVGTRERLDVHVVSSPYLRAALDRAATVTWAARQIPVATPEDLILLKLCAWRPQDQVDVGRLVTDVQALDTAYIERWLDPLADEYAKPLRTYWATVRRTPP